MNNDIFADMIRKYAKVKYTVKETNVYGVECSKIEIVFEKAVDSDSVTEIDEKYVKWFEDYLLPLVRRREINDQKGISYYPSNANIYKGGSHYEKKNKK